MTSLFADDELKNASPELLPPQENSYLLGLEAAEKSLFDAFHSGRMHHAWLIAGPEGVGKSTLAYRFARYILNASQSTPGDGLYMLPNHPVFRRIAVGGHTDLIVVKRSLNEKGKLRKEIVVDDVRRIAPFFSKTAGEGGWRVVIVDGVDNANQNAANALLKVLEEPPKQTILLLVCHNPGKLLPTIRSRCRRLDVRALEIDTMETVLGFYAPDLAASELKQLIPLAEGRIGRALDLIDHGGLELYNNLSDLLKTLPSMDLMALESFTAKVAKAKNADDLGRDGFSQFQELFCGWLQQLILLSSGAENIVLPRLNQGQFNEINRLVSLTTLDRLLQLWDKVTALLARTDRVNLDRKQVITSIFLSLQETLS